MKTMKRTMSILLAFVLVLCLLVTGSAEPGFCQNGETDDPSGLINHVQVTIPAPTGPEAIVSLEANIALQYYIEARMYLEKLSTADIDEMGPEAFKQLVDDSVTAFENADKISESLGRSVDLWMEADDTQRDRKSVV